MRALFVWSAPPTTSRPAPLSQREVMLLVDVDLGTFDSVPATTPLGEEIRAAKAHRETLRVWKPAPFVSQPDIPIRGIVDGLAWGWVEVAERAPECRVRMTVEMPCVDDGPFAVPDAPLALFLARRFRYEGGAFDVFVHDGLDVDRVAKALPRILEVAR